MNKSFDQSINQIVKHLRRGAGISPHVLLGPLAWKGSPDERKWYFLMGSGDSAGFRLDAIKFNANQELAEQTRSALHFALLQTHPIVVHDFDDECEMARWAHTIWASDKTREMLRNVIRERR